MKTHIPYIIIIVILSLFGFRQFNLKNQNEDRYELNYAAQLDSTKYYKNKSGEIVATKKSLLYTKKELSIATKKNKRLQESVKGFKKTIAVLQSTQKVEHDTIYVPFEKPIDCVFSRSIKYEDEKIVFSQTITNLGVLTPEIRFKPNKQDIVFGWKSKGMFKKSILTAEITNSNKAYENKDLKPITIHYKRSWYEKPIYTISIGILLGVVIAK